MASAQDIKRRIRSVGNTRKITRAMELVAAAKLKKAQSRIEEMRPYADRMLELMAGTARASTSVRGLPLLQQHERDDRRGTRGRRAARRLHLRAGARADPRAPLAGLPRD